MVYRCSLDSQWYYSSMMKRLAIAAISVSLAFATLAFAQDHQSSNDIAKQFADMWWVVSNPQRLSDGTTREGANSVAYAMVARNANHMCFVSMNPNRPRWKSETAPTAEEGLSAIKGFGAYCGTVEIHAKEGFIIRHYEINQTPNSVGKVTKRW